MLPALHTSLRPMSENMINQAFRRMGYVVGHVTSHGLRTTASTLLNESGRWSPDAIERSRAHADANTVKAIYNNGRYWDAARAFNSPSRLRRSRLSMVGTESPRSPNGKVFSGVSGCAACSRTSTEAPTSRNSQARKRPTGPEPSLPKGLGLTKPSLPFPTSAAYCLDRRLAMFRGLRADGLHLGI